MERLVIVGELANDEEFGALIEREGYQILRATNQDAVDLALEANAAMVILSRHVGDDLALLARLRDLEPPPEVIVVSTYANGVERSTDEASRRQAAEALDLGALDYLREPVCVKQLRLALVYARSGRAMPALDEQDFIAAE